MCGCVAAHQGRVVCSMDLCRCTPGRVDWCKMRSSAVNADRRLAAALQGGVDLTGSSYVTLSRIDCKI